LEKEAELESEIETKEKYRQALIPPESEEDALDA